MVIKEQLKNDIEASDLVLVGIGNEWKVEEGQDESAVLKGYENLKELLEGKNYYIITLCYDDVIYKVFEDDSKIVAPCGTKRLFQCDQHLVKANEAVEKDGKLYCPHCDKELVYNNIKATPYLEEGYIPKFAEYKKWLQGTVNKKLCILELGADLSYPTVIRFPFDKLCMYNLKSVFYRINKDLCQHTAENKERGISVNEDSVKALL